MLIRQSSFMYRGPIAAIFMMISVIGLFPIGTASRGSIFLFVFMSGFTCLVVFMELRARGASVEINAETRLIIFRRPGAILGRKAFAYALDDFSSVRSYISTRGEECSNLVELVTLSGGEALLLASYEPRWSSKGAIPVVGESADATALRKAIAAESGLEDEGYLGVRWPGVYISRKRRVSIGTEGG